ncbi:MAG: hypothetical protein QGG36_32475 [Pirellulaceae bacterium]|jgi:hypothetical protein|nr:hypothetical protein [Pirellulaceae bacterium]MDP7020561.1 hypothetical protein [Pirellulaceae bacterium]
MSKPDTGPELTAEQQQALDAGNGIVQGQSFVLMRTEVVLDWFGYSDDELRQELQPALDQVERGDVAEWNLNEFLAEMHTRHAAKTG